MRLTACDIWLEKACCCVAATRFVICSSDENCAIWPMKSLSSMGFIGSWCWSWVTRSFRKSSFPRMAFGFVPAAAAPRAPDVVGVTELIVPSSGEHVDLRPERDEVQLGRDVDDVLLGRRPVGRAHRLREVGCLSALAVRGGPVAGDVDVERGDLESLALERAAQVGRGLGERLC